MKGSLGNLVEWYDVYAYSVFQLYFKDSFFAPEDENSNIYVWAGFAVTFLARPVGAWFFGRFADRHGRKASLSLSVTIMALGSLLIAMLPTRDAIGLWAAALLMVLRLIQGFATGGEHAASATYMSEAATANRRGFFSSFQYVTLVGGHVLAQATLLILTAFMSKEELTAWGWRIPFFIGAIAALIVFWLRKTMDESLSEEHLAAVRAGEAQGSGSIRELFVRYWKPMLICFLFTLGGTVAFYTDSVDGPAMVKTIFKETDPQLANRINLASLVVLMLLQPLGGLISDRIGRKPVFLFFGALGVGLAYGLANSIFGGTAPMIYEWAKGDKNVPAFIVYVTLCILATFITTLVVMRNKHANHLDHEQGHAFAQEPVEGSGAAAAR